MSTSQDTLRDCSQETTCYNTVVSPIYFVSFVLTAQFVLVNVVIAVLMKHLEESNKEAKEEAELEAEMELEAAGGDGGISRGHMPPFGPGDMGGPGGSPWISRVSGDLSGPLYPTDSPPADIRRDSEDHIKTDPDPPHNLEPPLEVSGNARCEVRGVYLLWCNFQVQHMSQTKYQLVSSWSKLLIITLDQLEVSLSLFFQQGCPACFCFVSTFLFL